MDKEQLSKYVGSQIKKFRIEKNMTQEELAELTNTTKQTVGRYENGERRANQDNIFCFAQIFNRSINDFFPEVKNSNKEITYIYNKLEKPRQRKVYTYAEQQLEEQNKVVHIHNNNSEYVTETLRGYLSAGTGEMQLDEVNEEVEIPVEMIPDQHYDMLLQVNGDSMLPMFQDGERIFVRKINEPSELRSGQIGVFIIDGESFLKKAYKEDKQLRLVSLNDKYDDLIFNEVNDIEIVGTVVM